MVCRICNSFAFDGKKFNDYRKKECNCTQFIMLTTWFMLASLWSKLESKILFASVYWGIRLLHGIVQAFIQVTTYSIVGTWLRDKIIKVVGFIQFLWGWGIVFGPIFA